MVLGLFVQMKHNSGVNYIPLHIISLLKNAQVDRNQHGPKSTTYKNVFRINTLMQYGPKSTYINDSCRSRPIDIMLLVTILMLIRGPRSTWAEIDGPKVY